MLKYKARENERLYAPVRYKVGKLKTLAPKSRREFRL